MNEYVKPNLILPVSLHDARLSSIDFDNDNIIFIIEDGILAIKGDKTEHTGKTRIFFPKVDFDFCRVYCTGKDNYRQKWDIRDFAAHMRNNRVIIDIVDETYGYNQAKFSCGMYMNEDWYDCEIEIYHFGLMKYVWDDLIDNNLTNI